MNRDEATRATEPAQTPPPPAQQTPAEDKKTDQDHQGHRNEIDQVEGDMHNGELGAGIKKQNP